MDLRHSGYKLVPVDTNAFPAGFNNLSDSAKTRASKGLKEYIAKHISDKCKKILVITENHTRNLNYFDNLAVIKNIAENAGFEVRLCNLALEGSIEVTSAKNVALTIQSADFKNGEIITSDGFKADLILLNNDLSSGVPEILERTSQIIIPPVAMGWFNRAKTDNSYYYEQLVSEFAERFAIDAWLISCLYSSVDELNFKEKSGLERLAASVDKLISEIGKKYSEHNINEQPYVFIKADSGTYGMGIMTVRSGDEILAMNKDARKKMNVIKEGVVNTSVIIQEGVATIDKIDGKVAEPVIYLVGGKSAGGAYRVNDERDEYGNLNSSGMTFSVLCDDTYKLLLNPENPECNFCVFDMIARISALSASMEASQNK